MSGESLVHVRLVERLIEHVRSTHRPERGLLLLADHHAFGANRPPSIDGFTPDLFASDLPATFEILGEAKTPADLQTPRSLRQIAVFLDYLSVRPRSTFYLSVPPFTKRRSLAILQEIQRTEHMTVTIEVIDGV